MSASPGRVEECLRSVVHDKLANNEQVSVTLARSLAEQQLDLEEGFFKTDQWKQKSRDIIQDAYNRYVPDADHGGTSRTSESKSRKRARESNQDERASKRTKQSSDGESAYASDSPDEIPAMKSKSTVRSRQMKHGGDDEDEKKDQKQQQSEESHEDEATSVDDDQHNGSLEASEEKRQDEAMSESEMSSLIDEPAPKRKKQSTAKAQTTSKHKPSSAAQSKTDLSSDEELIKTLQSQLLKCGVRKLWHRELEPYPTNQKKIQHLREMLKEVGMTGRFSAAKASQIKESRELAAELESAKEFAKSWGTENRQAGRGVRSRASRSRLVTDDSDEDESDGHADNPIQAGAATGLVDFGDSGDDGSD